MTTRVAVSAHRGGGERHPAATWEAYRSAAATGADYVEFDVRRLADGRLVCYHDARARRTGPLLRTLSYRQLCAEVGYEVPTVTAVAAALAGRARGHVDLKETGYEPEVIRLALETFGAGGFVATSLEDGSLARITREFPGVRTGLSLGRARADVPPGRLLRTRLSELFPLRRIRACGAQWVAVDKTLARYGVLRQAARHGLGAMVWTVDDPRAIDQFLADSRVDVLVTNRPGYAVDRRRELARQAGGHR